MARHTTIDLGLPTEDLPEWSVSLDYSEKVEEQKTESSSGTSNPALGAELQNANAVNTGSENSASHTGSALDSGFRAEFVLDGDITSPSPSQNPNPAGTIPSTEENQTILGDNLSSFQQNADTADAFLGSDLGVANSAGSSEDSISTLGMSASANTAEESNIILGGDALTDQNQEEERIEIPEPASEQRTEPMTFQAEPEARTPIEPEPKEIDEVEERLNHLANSMKDWEQSEHALSEAAAMLSHEHQQFPDEEESGDDKPLSNLMKGLDNITRSLDRMSASAREDLADVIEQTQKSNELAEAINIMPEPTPEPEPVMEVQPEPILEPEPIMEVQPEPIPEPEPIMESQPEMVPEPEPTLEPELHEAPNMFSPEMQISNDMFDIGIDLSDDEMDFSDENINLDAFSGSIKDAEQINAPSENSIDLDAAGVNSEEQNSAGFDMSSLVAAAMNDLTGGQQDNSEPETAEEEPENSLEFISSDEPEVPEENESTLEFMASDEPMEEPESSLEFISSDEPEVPEENESTLEFMSSDEPMEEPESSLEFISSEEPEEPPQPEEVKLVFEPVYPEGAPSSVVPGMIDEISGDDDFTSMIIEDYSEVPTVSDIEDKLAKQEKEKKRNKSKKKKDDGFAYSLDDLEQSAAPKTTASSSGNPMPVFRMPAEQQEEQAREETAAAGEEQNEPQVAASHVVHKIGKIKRSYYRLTFQ